MTRVTRLRIVAAAVVLLAVGRDRGERRAREPVSVGKDHERAARHVGVGCGDVRLGRNGTAKFTCSLDGIAAACSSPKTYSGLAEGMHFFLVTATNTDRAGRVYTARDSHRWTIDLPGGPPPPPPPPAPKTASLLVTVEGGGQVSSEPAGISCPGDCEQSFPVGTKVTLSQKPAQGSRFAGWHGACDGAGACAPAGLGDDSGPGLLHGDGPGAAPVSRRPRGRRSEHREETPVPCRPAASSRSSQGARRSIC